ncbi:MAG: TonB-dependent receptor domain-containing protein, partial [Terriglobia bacterium]
MKRLSVLVFIVGFVLSASLLEAQNSISRGSITGRVTDPSGAVVPGAKVVVANLDTGVKSTTQTRSDGFFIFPIMQVGRYSLNVSKTGFEAVEVEPVEVQIGQTATQNVRLKVGSVGTTVTVTGSSPLLRPDQSTSSAVVNQSLIQALPLNGRRYTDFVLLTPNANADGEFGLISIGGQQGGGDSGYANGNGASSYTVDGANFTSNFYGDARGRTRVPYIFGENSVQEFQVSDSPYSAAYGGAGAGFVNTVTKSGGDQFHGNAFYYNRNSATGSNDAIDKANGVSKPLNDLQQFGGSLGGPVKHDKAWFFMDYEQQRQLDPISVINPGMQSLNETSFGVPAGTALPSPNAPYAAASSVTAPDPTNPLYLQQVSNALNAIQSNIGVRNRRRDDLSLFPKVDWQPDLADHITFSYNYNKFTSPGGEITYNPVSFDGVQALSNNDVHDHHATIQWTRSLRPNLLNDFHISFLRDDQVETPSGLTDPALPTFEIFSPQFFDLGNPGYALGTTHEFQWEANDSATYIKGKNNAKFGFDYDRTHLSDFEFGNFRGTYAFDNPTDFALGHYAFFTQSSGTPYFKFTVPYYGVYGQDKIQVRSNLSLNLGLREDFQVFAQPQENPAFPLTGQFPNQYKRLAPRLGFAYSPKSNTVVRGGFGVFYEILDGINYENSVVSNGLPSQQSSAFTIFNSGVAPNSQSPVVRTGAPDFGPVFPNIITSPAFFAGSSNLSLIDPGFQTPTILESSLEIERQFSPSTTLTVGTMWTHAYHLIASSAYDLNLIPPTGTTAYVVCPPGSAGPTCTGPSATGPNLDSGLLTDGLITSKFGQINALISPGEDTYNSFYVKLERRMSKGLESLISYTYSKDLCTDGTDFYNQFNLSNLNSPCLLDQRNRLSIAGVYTPHFGGSNATARKLLNNWVISTEMAFNSGRPYAALLNTSPSGNMLNDSAFNESTNNTADGINASGISPAVGLNSLYGSGMTEIDLGISRIFHVREKETITLMAEAFNLFNTSNFYVQNGVGINQVQYNPMGANCGDGATQNQTCYLMPNSGPGGYGTLESIGQLNGPR